MKTFTMGAELVTNVEKAPSTFDPILDVSCIQNKSAPGVLMVEFPEVSVSVDRFVYSCHANILV